MIWPDNGGSVAELLCMMPLTPAEREEMHAQITANLYDDFTDREQELYEVLKPLLGLFANGEYDLDFRASKTSEELGYTASDGRLVNYAWYTQYPQPVELARAGQLKRDYKAFCQKHQTDETNAGLVDFTSSWEYPGGADRYVATRPLNEIDEARVRYFEEQIADGARPWVLVVRAYYAPHHNYSDNFILDGHHKMAAYNKLGIIPPLALITQYIPTHDDSHFDAEALATRLYPWQMRNLLNHWDEDDKAILLTPKLINPNSPLHQHMRNGLVKEYHDNQILRSEGFYINDKPDGLLREWHDNGQLKTEKHYSKGRKVGTWKEYFPSGNLHGSHMYNNEGHIDGEIVSYYESGQKRSFNEYENGLTKPDSQSLSWYEDGSPEYEATYKAGRRVEIKRWNRAGKITDHEMYDTETQSYKKI